MTKIVQINRQVADIINAYAGAEGEITATIDSHELRLHDGTTPGGHRFLNKSINDQLYQAVSDELTALSELNQERGLLVRTGDAEYLIRKIIGFTNEIVVENGDGFVGDITVRLPSTIDKVISFIQTISFENGIVGTLQGDVQGNVSGNLSGDANGNHTGSFTGDVDIRGAQFLVDDAQIPLAAIAGNLVLVDNPGVLTKTQTGTFITLWSGSVASIPSGWALCDGTNGLPDLRDKFIVGAGAAYNPGANGGALTHGHVAASVSTGAHNHPITVADHALTLGEIPAHFHGSGYGLNDTSIPIQGYDAVSGAGRIESNNGSRSIQARTTTEGLSQAHSHSASAGNNGAHSHVITVDVAGHLPPYYALCYIGRI